MANEQRKVIYSQRDELLHADDIADTIHEIAKRVMELTISCIFRRIVWKKSGMF